MAYRCPDYLKAWLASIEGDERFVMTVAAGAIDGALLMLGYLSGGEYVTLTLGTVAVYISGKTMVDMAASNSDAKIAASSALTNVAASRSDASIAASTGETPPFGGSK